MSEKRYSQEEFSIAIVESDIRTIKSTVNKISKKLDENYVTKDELRITQIQLELLQKLVYGVVGIILTTVVSGLVLFYINR